jgi:hypothetical protein
MEVMVYVCLWPNITALTIGGQIYLLKAKWGVNTDLLGREDIISLLRQETNIEYNIKE